MAQLFWPEMSWPYLQSPANNFNKFVEMSFEIRIKLLHMDSFNVAYLEDFAFKAI